MEMLVKGEISENDLKTGFARDIFKNMVFNTQK